MAEQDPCVPFYRHGLVNQTAKQHISNTRIPMNRRRPLFLAYIKVVVLAHLDGYLGLNPILYQRVFVLVEPSITLDGIDDKLALALLGEQPS